MPAETTPSTALSAWLSRLPAAGFALFAAAAAFTCYFSMYAFRKPFTAAAYDGMTFLGGEITLKTAFVLSQLIGYTLSKYIGVKVCSETTRDRRAGALVKLVLASWAALFLFAVVPGPWKAAAIFLNGLPLGMVWGLVVAYLEGRRCSDFLMAALCGSFIVASAAVKDVGRWLMSRWQVSEDWMPAATAALFLPVFLLAVHALSSLPEPGASDKAARKPREAMDRSARRAFLRSHAPGILTLLVFYFFLTAYRDSRDNFGVEIFRGLGYGAGQTALFTRAEIPVAVASLAALALLNGTRDNRLALLLAHGFMMLGMAVLVAATLATAAGGIDGLGWMICTGLGAYLAYVPINAVLFERMMAATGSAGTAVFGIQLADSVGYTGSALIQLLKDFGSPAASHLAFFDSFSLALGIGGLFLSTAGALYFHRRTAAEVLRNRP